MLNFLEGKLLPPLQEPDSSSESAAEMELLEELPPPETAQLGPDGADAGAFSEFSGTREAHGEGLFKDKGEGYEDWKMSSYESHQFARWWFQIFFIFTPTWGRFPFD